MGRIRGLVWLLAGLVIALTAGAIAFRTLNQVAQTPAVGPAAGPTVLVVTAARALPIRTLLTAADLAVVEIPVDLAPEGAVATADEAIGKLSLVDLYAGEPVIATRLLAPNLQAQNGRLAVFLVEDEVLMAIPAMDLLSRINQIRAGDRVDILFSLPVPTDRTPAEELGPTGGGGNAEIDLMSYAVLQNVAIAAIVGGETGEAAGGGMLGGGGATVPAGPPEALLLTLPPQDALVLKYMVDAGGTLDFVLRAPGVERPFDVDPVDMDYLIDRYDLPIQIGR
jgi:pilus assembly protein CpaB